MKVRLATLEDVESCADIVGGQPLWERYAYPRSQVLKDLKGAATSPGHRLWIADDGRVRGFAWIVKKGGMGRSDYLRLIAVKRGTERGGIGAALLDVAEVEAGKPGMFLLVSDFNIHAQRFYARRGYTEVGQLPDYVIADVTECIYFKPGTS